MAGEPLTEQLALDISPALDALQPLGVALNDLVQGFSTSFADALSGITAQPIDTSQLVDASAISTEIDQAVADASPAPVPVDADASQVDVAIADALDAPRPPLPVEADVTQAEAAIATLDGDTVQVAVEADTTQADTAITDLGQSATDATGSGGGEGLLGLGSAMASVEAAAGLAAGQTTGLTDAVSGLGPEAQTGIVALGALTALIGDAATKAADAQAQQARFNEVFGASAEIVKNIDVGGLTISMEDLGAKTGTTTADLEAAASKLGQIGTSAGAAIPQVAETTAKLEAVSAVLSVTNPRLGDTADVMNALERALVRPGVRLAQLGLSFTQTQLQQEAFNETGKTTVAELTNYDKIQAGVNLAVAQFGDTLGTKFAQGAQNAQVQFRAMKTEVEESLVTLGTPLLQPLVTSLGDVIPVAVEVGQVIGGVAQIVLPFVAILAQEIGSVAPALHGLAVGLDAVASVENHLLGPSTQASGALGGVSSGANTASHNLGLLAPAFDAVLGPIGNAFSALNVVGHALDLFGDHAKKTAVDTGALQGVFSGLDSSSATLESTFSGISGTLDKFLTSALNVGKAGQTGADGAQALGVSIAQIGTALVGTNPQFDNLVAQAKNSRQATDDGRKAVEAYLNVITQGRAQLEAQAEATLQGAVQQKQLTQAQVDGELAMLAAKGDAKDYVTALRDLSPAIDAVTTAQGAQALSTAASSGAIADLAAQYAAGKLSADGFAAALVALHVSQTDAKTISTDVTGAIDAQKDALTAASPAATQLAEQYASGQISAGQYAAALLQLGITVGGLKSAMSEADQIQKDVLANQQLLTDDTALLTPQVQQLSQAYLSGFLTAGQYEEQLTALGISIPSVKQNISQLDSAVNTLVTDMVKALPSTQDAATTFAKDIGDAFKTLSSDVSKSKGDVQADVAGLKAALDPTALIHDVFANAFAAVNLVANLEKLPPALAAFITTQVPAAVRPALAQALVASQPDQQALLKGLVASGAVQDAYATYIRTHVAPSLVAPALQAGGNIGESINLGAAAAANLGLLTTQQVDQVQGALAAGISGARAEAGLLGQGATDAYNAALSLPPHASQQVAQATGALAAGISGMRAKGADLGTGATDAFGGALDPATQAQQKFGDAANTIAGLTAAQFQAGIIGVDTGEAFGQGLANGISEKSDVIASAASQAAHQAEIAAKAALGISSPSTVGIAIGENFATSVAFGVVSSASVASIANAAASLGADAAAPLSQALQSFVTSALSALPTAAQAIHQWSASVGADYGVLVRAVDTLAQAQDQLAQDRSLNASATQITSDLNRIHNAQIAVSDAAKALQLAATPQAFVAELVGQNRDLQAFEQNLQGLTKQFPLLAEELAKQGPQAAGALAALFDAHPGQAAAAEAALKAGQSFTDAYTQFLQKNFPDLAKQTAAAIGGSSDVQFLLDAATKLDQALAHSVATSAHIAGFNDPDTIRSVIGALDKVVDKQLIAAGVAVPVNAPVVASPPASPMFNLHLPALEINIETPAGTFTGHTEPTVLQPMSGTTKKLIVSNVINRARVG